MTCPIGVLSNIPYGMLRTAHFVYNLSRVYSSSWRGDNASPFLRFSIKNSAKMNKDGQSLTYDGETIETRDPNAENSYLSPAKAVGGYIPVWGATRFLSHSVSSFLYFNPRSPCGERQQNCTRLCCQSCTLRTNSGAFCANVVRGVRDYQSKRLQLSRFFGAKGRGFL